MQKYINHRRKYHSSDFDFENLSKQLWLKGDDTSTLWQNTGASTAVDANGQSVLRWDDKSGANFDLTQGVSGSAPTYTTSLQNGKAGVSFDNSWLTSVSNLVTASTTAFTFFLVMRYDDTGVFYVTIFNDNTNSPWGQGVGYNDDNTGSGDTLHAWINGVGTNYVDWTTDANFHIHEFSWNGTQIELKVDNLSQGTASFSSTITEGGGGFELGKDLDGSGGFEGDFLEIVYFNTYDAARNTNTYNYLKTYWGL